MACRTQAQLHHRPYHPYSVLWVPTPAPASEDAAEPNAVPLTKEDQDQGVLTIWPTHLITHRTTKRVSTNKPIVPIHVPSSEDHLGLMTAASSLFDIVSAYKEPAPDNTPPSDRSIEESAAIPDPQEAHTPISQPSPVHDQGSDAEDDLENLFASDTPPRTPEPFEPTEAFEMFGEPSSRRISNGNNAHLIDYGDVVMSSPPAREERRTSLRSVMGESDVVDEPEAAFVTEDDFNFFDSPPDNVEQEPPAPEASNKEPEGPSAPTAEPAQDDNLGEEPNQAEQTPVEPVVPPEVEPEDEKDNAQPERQFDSASPKQVRIEQTTFNDQVALPHSLPTPASTASIPESRSSDNRGLVPSAFEPLELSHPGTTFTYSLPSPAPTPQNLNADLIERLSSPKATKKAYEYAAAWFLDSPPSETDDDEYTGPPTPISEIDDYDESTATPIPLAPVKAGSGVLEYDGMPCVSTEWFGMIDELGRAHTLSRPWVKTWTSHTPDTRPAVSERKASKKRKRSSDTGKPAGELDLAAFATQVICNRELRLQLIKRNASLHHDVDPEIADLGTMGTSLVDFAPPSDADDSLGVVDQELSADGNFKQCDIHLGFRGNVMRMSIASLRYWRELDLQPLGGDKDVKAIALVEGQEHLLAAKQVCTRFGDTYKVSGSRITLCLDAHFHRRSALVGTSSTLLLGMVVCRAHQARKVSLCLLFKPADLTRLDPLGPAMQWIAEQEGNAAILLICSSLTTSSLRTYLDPSLVSGIFPTQVIHFVPLSTLVQRDVHDVARALYDRFPRQLRRVDHVHEGEAPWYQYPSFTLSPDDPPKPNLTLQWPIKSFDVFGSWRWIHLAYGWSQDRQSLIVMVSDGEGEDWVVKVVPLSHDPKPQAKIKAVWDITSAFATSAATEHRISICHMGIMAPKEIEGKSNYVSRSH